MTASLRPYDEALLRQAFDVAKRSRAGGDHPFGSVLADSGGRLLMEQGNGYSSEGGDRTAHAERLLASRAARTYDLDFLGAFGFTSPRRRSPSFRSRLMAGFREGFAAATPQISSSISLAASSSSQSGNGLRAPISEVFGIRSAAGLLILEVEPKAARRAGLPPLASIALDKSARGPGRCLC